MGALIDFAQLYEEEVLANEKLRDENGQLKHALRNYAEKAAMMQTRLSEMLKELQWLEMGTEDQWGK